jgi:hypothetical protein
MKLVFDNSSIECLSAHIVSRKIIPSAFIEIFAVGKCLTYRCSRNSEATILKELVPKRCYFNINSYLDLNAKIECENLYVVVNKSKPYKYDLINHSARHKALQMITNEYTFAKITKQIPNIPQAIPPVEFKPVEVK